MNAPTTEHVKSIMNDLSSQCAGAEGRVSDDRTLAMRPEVFQVVLINGIAVREFERNPDAVDSFMGIPFSVDPDLDCLVEMRWGGNVLRYP